MRVWIVSVGEPLPSDGNNVRLRRMGNLASYLTSNPNNTVDWFSVSFDHYKKTQRVKVDSIISIKNNYKMHLVYVNGYKRNISFSRIIHHIIGGKKIYKKMVDLRNQPDIILASMEPLEISSAAIKYKKCFNIPTVIDIRDLWPEIYYEVINPRFHWALRPYVWYCKKMLSNTLSQATAIVGLSSEFLKYGLRYAHREQTDDDQVIPIAYPNYDYSVYKDNWALLEERFNLTREDFIVVFLGNFGNQFDFDPVIQAAHLLSKYPSIRFVLCGTGVQLEDVKKKSPESVLFTGWIEKEEILTLTANSSLGLAPYIDSMNYRLNTPNKFGEYLSASVLPIISVSGVMEDLLAQYECGNRYRNGESLACIIEDYYLHPEKLVKASNNARKLYEEMFNGDTVNERFSDYLETLVGGNTL